MNNKEYLENQKIQRRSFKKYCKHMIKLLISLLFAGASAFVFPSNIFVWLNNLLKGIIGSYLSASITVWTQILCMFGGVLSGIYHAYKASKSKDEIDIAQDEEENFVDRLINENDNLTKKVENLEKEKEVENKKSNTKSDLIKNNREISYEEEKVKKYTK